MLLRKSIRSLEVVIIKNEPAELWKDNEVAVAGTSDLKGGTRSKAHDKKPPDKNHPIISP